VTEVQLLLAALNGDMLTFTGALLEVQRRSEATCWALTSTCSTFNSEMLNVQRRSTATCGTINGDLSGAEH
jgi:hypothetical protein